MEADREVGKRCASQTLCLVLVPIWGGGIPAADAPAEALPFTVKMTEEKMADHMGPRNPVDMDFPYCPVDIDGEYWIIYRNGITSQNVCRFKGTNIEDAVRHQALQHRLVHQ